MRVLCFDAYASEESGGGYDWAGCELPGCEFQELGTLQLASMNNGDISMHKALLSTVGIR